MSISDARFDVLRALRWMILLGGALGVSGSAFAQVGSSQITGAFSRAAESQRVDERSEAVEEATRSVWNTGSVGPRAEKTTDAQAIRPFGYELFMGGFRGVRADGLNPNYAIMPGDQIIVRVWGAVEIDRVLPVDSQGNIFIPTVGPVRVQGLEQRQVSDAVERAIRRVYPRETSIYTNLQGIQPVAVFVTGAVSSPGRYAGVPNDSVLFFLDQAGGIDEKRGSFRSIRILRDDRELVAFDLYQFLLDGTLPRVQFNDGDVILVGDKGREVVVEGEIPGARMYEFGSDTVAGNAIVRLARPGPGVSHALVRRQSEQGPSAQYLSLEEFREVYLAHGDRVEFKVDQRADHILIQLEGSYHGPSQYVLPKNATLYELLNNIEITPGVADVRNVSIRRRSVSEQQQQSLDDALRRLEQTYLVASSQTAEEAGIRVREAELIERFVARARELEPTGRFVVTRDDRVVDIRLMDGDVVSIPEVMDSVLVSGEVLVPQSMVFVSGETASDYIRRSGGFTRNADTRRILVARLNGEVREAGDIQLRAGDEIIVLPRVPLKSLQIASTISQILFQIAVTTRVALDL